MTKSFKEQCEELCPHCKNGYEATFRPETREWVHTIVRERGTGMKQFTHTMCGAHELRIKKEANGG